MIQEKYQFIIVKLERLENYDGLLAKVNGFLATPRLYALLYMRLQ